MDTIRGVLCRAMLLVLFPLGLLPATLWGGQASNERSSPQAFVLTVHEQRLSLRAREASLTAILTQIGRELGIDVVAHLPEDETITVAFDDLPVVEALKKLSTNYAYVVDTAKADNRITKIVIFSKGETAPRPSASLPPDAQSTESSARPAPFRFEFDPSQGRPQGK
jgi:hypothetical protein